MNERIRELYEQAMEQHVSNNMAWEELNPEKFVELIVKECVRIIDNKKDQAIDEEWKVDEAMSAASFDIEDHFGIKE
jgi:hypothetical protein